MACENDYKVQCDCGEVQLYITGLPKAKAYCHCSDCRAISKEPVHGVVAWGGDDVEVVKGTKLLGEYKLPDREMVRYFCTQCGTTVFSTSIVKWRLVSHALLSQPHHGVLPSELMPEFHLFYAERVMDVKDALPKYLDRGKTLYQEPE